MINDEGFVFILDRAKDLIIRGGENISCAEVEGAFFELDAGAYLLFRPSGERG